MKKHKALKSYLKRSKTTLPIEELPSIDSKSDLEVSIQILEEKLCSIFNIH
jgi:hypothetical protein